MRMRTHTHACTRAHACIHSHSRMRIRAHAQARTHAHACEHTLKWRIRARAHTHTTGSDACKRTHAIHMHARTCTCVHDGSVLRTAYSNHDELGVERHTSEVSLQFESLQVL